MFQPTRLVTSSGHRHNKYSILKGLITPAGQRHVKKSKLNSMQPINLTLILCIPHSIQSPGEIYYNPNSATIASATKSFHPIPADVQAVSKSPSPPEEQVIILQCPGNFIQAQKLGAEASQPIGTGFFSLFHQFTGHISFIEFPAYLPPTPTCCARQVNSS